MRRLLAVLLLLPLAACSRPQPPVGKWEGGLESGGVLVAARVEIGPDGLVRLSAPDIAGLDGVKPDQMGQWRARVAADLANGWDGVKPRKLDFDGKTFRNPGGTAPQLVWNADTGEMTAEIYIGRNPALPVVLRPVDGFHDDPFGSG